MFLTFVKLCIVQGPQNTRDTIHDTPRYVLILYVLVQEHERSILAAGLTSWHVIFNLLIFESPYLLADIQLSTNYTLSIRYNYLLAFIFKPRIIFNIHSYIFSLLFS